MQVNPHPPAPSADSDLWTQTQDRPHPVRAPKKAGKLYQRFIPQLNRTLSFRTVDLSRDLIRFHKWHHQPRVYEFWELNRSIEELEIYLKKGLEDPHQFSLILEWDEIPVGYFEVYWTPEDRLGAYYDYHPYDRGFHFLIGNEAFLGFENTDAAIKSICHFLFLEDPRTLRIMAEPRHDNVRVLKYVESMKAWKKIKWFDFPHKRALLIECDREEFFSRRYV